jgi:hypothetical protein
MRRRLPQGQQEVPPLYVAEFQFRYNNRENADIFGGNRRMLIQLWKYKWRILLCLAAWLVFECWISWVAFCDQINDYRGYQRAAEENSCIFRGPLASIIRSFERWFQHTFDKPDAFVALFTLVLTVVTGALWWSTRNLWQATVDSAKRQEKDTEILQRAYVSAEPLGVEPMQDKNKVIAHVDYRNVGHLPAREFQSSYVRMKWTSDDTWGETALGIQDVLEYKSVLPVQGKVTAGARTADTIAAEHLAKKIGYIWVWGILTYMDEFSATLRYTKFCHRYPCAQARGNKRIGFSIDARYGRYHHHGNEAD